MHRLLHVVPRFFYSLPGGVVFNIYIQLDRLVGVYIRIFWGKNVALLSLMAVKGYEN